MELQWPLILFTFFVCASSGVLFVQGILTAAGKAKKLQIPSLITSLVLLAVGGIAVFTHLQHWERIFNGFGHITSGITQELIGVVVMAIVLVLYFLMVRRSEDGQAPKWVGILAAIVAVGMVIVMAHSYNMPARPAWNGTMLILYYLINMGLLGALIVLVLAAALKADDAYPLTAKLGVVFAILQLIIVIIFAVILQNTNFAAHGYYFDPTIPDVAVVDTAAMMSSIMSGSQALSFWGGAVVCGAVLPAVLMILVAKKFDNPSTVMVYGIIALLGATVGSFCWRCILYVVAATVFAIF